MTNRIPRENLNNIEHSEPNKKYQTGAYHEKYIIALAYPDRPPRGLISPNFDTYNIEYFDPEKKFGNVKKTTSCKNINGEKPTAPEFRNSNIFKNEI